MTFTREQIAAILVGKTKIAHGIDGRFCAPTQVVEIYCRREDIAGKLFVCGYRAFGDNARISFSIKEGDEVDSRHYRIERPANCLVPERAHCPDGCCEPSEGR